MSYNHLTPICRGRIQGLHEQGKSANAIAEIMGRHRTTISRELRRNQVAGNYEAAKAQRRYEGAAWSAGRRESWSIRLCGTLCLNTFPQAGRPKWCPVSCR